MLTKQTYNAILRAQYNLNPAYTWAVENYEKMRAEMPNFEQIYKDGKPRCYIVSQATPTQVRVEIEPGRMEWHSKHFYIIVPSLLPH